MGADIAIYAIAGRIIIQQKGKWAVVFLPIESEYSQWLWIYEKGFFQDIPNVWADLVKSWKTWVSLKVTK